MPKDLEQGWLSLDELMKQLGVSRRTLYRRIDAGVVETQTIAGRKYGRPVERADTGPRKRGTRAAADSGEHADAMPLGADIAAQPSTSALLALVTQYEDERKNLVAQLLDATRKAAEFQVSAAQARGENERLRLEASQAVAQAERLKDELEALKAAGKGGVLGALRRKLLG